MMSSSCTVGNTASMMTLAQSSAPAPPSAKSADDNKTAFRPVGDSEQSTSGEILLVEAYAVIWLLAFLLIVASVRKQRSLDARIVRLQEDLTKARGAADAAGGG